MPFESRLPATDRRRGPPRPTQPAAPRLAGATACDHARRKPAHARRFGRLPTRVPPRLHRLSQLHTQRADEAPVFSPDRSLSGRSQLQCSRPADLRLLRSQPAHGAAGLCAAAPSRTLQPGGQRSHRTKADRGSQPSASVGTRPVRPDRRGRARAAAERRSGRRAAFVSARRRFPQSSMKVAGNKYGSAVYLLNCVTGSHNTLQVCTSVSATLPTS